MASRFKALSSSPHLFLVCFIQSSNWSKSIAAGGGGGSANPGQAAQDGNDITVLHIASQMAPAKDAKLSTSACTFATVAAVVSFPVPAPASSVLWRRAAAIARSVKARI